MGKGEQCKKNGMHPCLKFGWDQKNIKKQL